jgi:subtilase family serine protease
MIRKLGQCLLAIVSILAVGTINSHAQYVQTHHVRDVVRNGEAQPVGRLPENQVMTLDIVLPITNQAGLDEFLKELADPNSPSYRHYLTPAEFTARFGPSQADYNAVVSYVKANGFQIIGGSRDAMDVGIKGPVSAVEAAFHVTMRTYKDPVQNRVFYSLDREPTTSLSFPLWHISGMDNYSIPHPMYETKSQYAAKHGLNANEVVSHATTGSGPSASFLGSDMRAAYYGTGSLTGSGQTVGLLEYYGTDLSDLDTYYKNVDQTNNVPISLVSTDGTSTSCVDSRSGGDCDDTEQTIDMTQALGMAPGLAQLTMYVGSTDTAIISAMTTTADGPLPGTIGCSWGWTPADPSTLDPYFEKMASQGQNFFAASGDDSTWSSSNEAWPADDANVVSVGGTDLETSSAAGPWKSETAWSDSGGGISPDKIAIPSWQQISGVINSSNKGSTTYRNGPDVSANANFTFYVCADQTTCTANEYGGTSFATPMWAAYIALVNQQLAADGKSAIGYLNPVIYPENVTSVYDSDFHDITSGTSGSYSAVTGYDLVTGWGSPNSNLIAELTGSSSSSPSFSVSASPTSLSVAAGSSGSSTISTAVSGGFDSAVTLSASGQPSGVTVTFSPTSITGAGSSTATFAVASTVAAGTYGITITGTSGSTTASTVVSLTVTTTSSGTFTVSVSPSSGYLDQGQSGYAVVTTSVSGGFDAAISFSASGQPSGVTVSFSPASIAAPGSGSTDMDITVSRSAATGTYPITITATGGGVTKTTTLTFEVRR